MLMTRCQLCSNSTTKWKPCRCYERLEQFSLTCLSLACVAWRFCGAGRTSGAAARKIKSFFSCSRPNLLAVSLPSPAFITWQPKPPCMLRSLVCLNWATFAARFLIYWLKRIPYCTFKLIDTLFICIFSYSFYGNYLLRKEANRCITTKKNNE